MSLAIDFPVIETGDFNAQAEAWRFTSFSDENTDRGRLYVNVVSVSATVAGVEVYRDRDRTSLVASGTANKADLPERVTLAEQNESGLSGSVYLGSAEVSSAITVWVALATTRDLCERDRDLEEFLLDDETDFGVILQATMRRFMLRLGEFFPPHPTYNDPLSLWKDDAPRTRSRYGDADQLSIYLWGENNEGDFELIGLQNPGDWKEWAIQYGLGLAWDRNNRGANEPISLKAERYFQRAKDEFRRPVPWVDVDRNKTADRPTQVRSIRLRRG